MKKRWLIPVIIIAVILILAGGCFAYMSANFMSFSTGRCIVTSNGAYMILLDNSPITMSNISNREALFSELKTGDEILILHDGIQETYPGGTGVYYCRRLKEGSIADIPDEVIESLSPMGWIPVDASGKTREIYTGTVVSYEASSAHEGHNLLTINSASLFEENLTLTVVQSTDAHTIEGLAPGDQLWLSCTADTSGYREVQKLIEYQTVSYKYGYANMRLELPAGWAYEICEYDENNYAFGINFWPENASEGKLRLEYYPQEFGVCGTGLVQEQIRLDNGMCAFQGTYDNHEVWDFISIRELPGSYVISTENVSGWWDTYGDQAMDIIGSLWLAEDILWENMAIEIAEHELKGEFEAYRADFDFCEGVWYIQFIDQSITYTVCIGSDGTVKDVTTFNPNQVVARKPVIYLYPEQEALVTVKLDFDGKLNTTYPEYNDGWTVLAQPDGTLTDPSTGREYYCLFWEGISDIEYDMSTGFVVSGADTEAFLEDALTQMGLSQKEANEFIIYWLPQMEGNAYNLISFQQEAYTEAAKLDIDPAPDSLLRVFMAWKALDRPIEIEPQEFTAFERKGFTVVEWGGTRLP